MNFVVFDTETTSLEKPFCYNIGYVICNEDFQILEKRDFIAEQIWHNLPLFSTAYYADKRNNYVQSMRKHETIMEKFGHICMQMRRDFTKYDISYAFAYNSPFDDRVFSFNCDWFKCLNPFDNIEICDIRGHAHNFLIDDKYKAFCEKNQYFTESENYSSTAETVYRFITNNTDFIEDHTALSDSLIEMEILKKCVENGACLFFNHPVKQSIERKTIHTLHIKTAEQTDFYFNYEKIRINKNRTEIKLK